MRKKIIILCFLIILFCGCTVNYEINIDDIIEENINIGLDEDEDENVDIYSGLTVEPVSFISKINSMNDIPISVLSNQLVDIYDEKSRIEGTLYYDTNIKSTPHYSFNMNAKFDFENIEYLKSVKNCYEEFDVSTSKNYITITTSEKNMCFEIYPILDKINIKIKTRYDVIDSNATSIDEEEKTYTWIIDRSNYTNKSIYLKLDSSSKEKNISIFTILIIIFASVLIFSGIIFLVVKFVSNRNNKI